KVMAEQNRLSALKVRIARQNCVGIFLREPDESALQSYKQCSIFIGFVSKIEPKVQGDLVVSAASCVQLGSGGTDACGQSRLDIHVNVFESDLELESVIGDFVSNGFKARFNQLAFFLGQQAGLFKGCGVRQRTLDIDLV